MLQTILNNAQIFVVLGFVLLSVLGQVARKVQEQREIRRRKMAQEQARLDMLRTGRSNREGSVVERPGSVMMPGPMVQTAPAPLGPPTSAAEAVARLEEIARRRQEQMGKVRTAGPTSPRRGKEQTGPVIVMGPTGPIVLRPGQTFNPAMPAGAPAAGPTQRKAKQPKQPKQPKNRPAPAPEPAAPSGYEPPRVAPAPAPAALGPSAARAARAPVLGSGTPRTPEEWRRLAAATAIFGRPVGEQGGDGAPGRLF
jgi:hypothetical protein